MAMRAEAQNVQYGGPVPLRFFVNARYFHCEAGVSLWHRNEFLTLGSVAGGVAAQPTDMFSYGLGDRARRRTAEVLSRRQELPPRGNRPRFAFVDDDPPDPTPEERAERVRVGVSIYLRDATEDFPSPIPRGLRVIAVMLAITADRVSADADLAGQWIGLPSLTIETVAPRTAEDRVLEVLEAALARRFVGFRWGRRSVE